MSRPTVLVYSLWGWSMFNVVFSCFFFEFFCLGVRLECPRGCMFVVSFTVLDVVQVFHPVLCVAFQEHSEGVELSTLGILFKTTCRTNVKAGTLFPLVRTAFCTRQSASLLALFFSHFVFATVYYDRNPTPLGFEAHHQGCLGFRKCFKGERRG